MNQNQSVHFSVKEWFQKQKISLLVLAICVVLFVIFYAYANSNQESATTAAQTSYTEYETAKVTSVLSDDSSKSEAFENNYTGSQDLMIEITSGQYKGTGLFLLKFYQSCSISL